MNDNTLTEHADGRSMRPDTPPSWVLPGWVQRG